MAKPMIVVNEIPNIVIVCPKCHALCYHITMKKLSDGNWWTNDTCWKCGVWLPKVRVEIMTKTISLKDFEIRYTNIRKQNPTVKKCSITGCNNPRDSTPLLGSDTSCAYHRLLFDYWACDVMDNDKFHHYLSSQKGRRRAFTNWRNRTAKADLDKIVLRLAQEGINWEC